MKVKYSPAFLALAKKANVRIRKHLEERIEIFSKDPNHLQLRNHPLKDKYLGYRSIDVTSDWRAIYQEVQVGGEIIAYFVALGTHEQLYK
jgi:addiction module RelE/StbE family toxin